MRSLITAAILVVSIFASGCSQQSDDGPTDQQRACINQRFPGYNPKRLEQCVNACRICMSGTTTTCTTSCTLKGATN